MTSFAIDWLRAREPFDRAARDDACARRFAHALRQTAEGPITLVDLAAGSGANFRALAPVIGTDQDWVLVDHDATLLASQGGEITRWADAAKWRVRHEEEWLVVDASTRRWRARARGLDLCRALEAIDLAAFDGVTTCAFLDLVSGEWLDRLAVVLAAARRPFLGVLTVDGRRTWQPPLADDADVLAAFASHQRGDKGFGASLGVDAAPHLARRLAEAGFKVTMSRSDWHVGADAHDFLSALLDDSVRAAAEAVPLRATVFERWAAARRKQLVEGTASLEVGHVDLVALPPP